MRRTRIALVTLAFAGVAAAAAAQTSSSGDPLDNATVRFGSFGITPTILVSDIGTDDNVYNDATDPKSDFTFTITPKAEVLFRPSFMHVTYTEATDYVYYRKYTDQRGINEASSVSVEGAQWFLQPFASVTGANSRARLNEEIDERGRHHERTYTGGIRFNLATRSWITASVHRSQLTYDQGVAFRGQDLAATLNSRTDSADLGFGMQLTPITSVTITADTERQRFAVANERNSRTFRLTPTIAFVPGGVLSGSLSVGYRRFTADSPDVPDFSGLVATGTVGITTGRYNIQTTVTRDLRYSYERATPYYLASGAGVTLTTVLFGPLDVHVSGSRESMDYRYDRSLVAQPPPGAGDAFYRYGVGLGLRLRQRFRVGVNGDWTTRHSDLDAARAFNNHRIFATLTWGNAQ